MSNPIKNRWLGFRCRNVGVLAMAVLATAWVTPSAAANRRDDRADNVRQNRNGGPPPVRFVAPPQPTHSGGTVRQPTVRPSVDSPAAARQSRGRAVGPQLSIPSERRNMFAAAGDTPRDAKRKDQPAPPPRQEPRREAPRPPVAAPKSSPPPRPAERPTSSSPSSAAGDRSRISGLDKRLEKKSGPAAPGSANRGRKTDAGHLPADQTPTLRKAIPLLPQGDRTKPSDVRRQVPGLGPASPVQPSGRLPSGAVVRDVKQGRPPQQLKPAELDRLTHGETAQKIQLAQQYRMFSQGDVARRLDLQKHAQQIAASNHAANVQRFHGGVGPAQTYVHHPGFYHGVVSTAYASHCLQYHYWGPTFFAGLCWYPRWNPWVEWSWHRHWLVPWDPRPAWCRPITYDPCPRWSYWQTPAFVALPVVGCGTWVDLKPVVVAPATSDLQLVAVRFVDPGHPEQKSGPRYRVWFRNNGAMPVVQPFNVMLFAGNDGRLAANLPQAGVRVTAIEAGDTQSVDIRLPIEVYAMGRDAQGQPVPFSTLHVLVDAGREVPDVTWINNGARLSPAEILPIDPAAFQSEPAAARPGEELVLAGEGFGPEPGQVLVHVGQQELQGEILGWYDLGVRLALPKAAILAPTEAEVIVIRGDGAAANPLKIAMNP